MERHLNFIEKTQARALWKLRGVVPRRGLDDVEERMFVVPYVFPMEFLRLCASCLFPAPRMECIIETPEAEFIKDMWIPSDPVSPSTFAATLPYIRVSCAEGIRPGGGVILPPLFKLISEEPLPESIGDMEDIASLDGLQASYTDALLSNREEAPEVPVEGDLHHHFIDFLRKSPLGLLEEGSYFSPSVFEDGEDPGQTGEREFIVSL